VKIRTATLALVVLAGCGRNSGFLRDANTINEHQFRMDITAQSYERSVMGSSAIPSILCIIPLDDAPYAHAMTELHTQAKLERNEVLENIREDHAFVVYFGMYCLDKLTISADVYQVMPVAVPKAADPLSAKSPPPSAE
jgi:hypothetical protein